MKEIKDLVLGVVDHGIFLPVAQKLAEQVGQVFYSTERDDAYPSVKTGLIGEGLERLERVDSILAVKGQCDGFVFPDIGWSDLQLELEGQGYPVWGAREGDSLESSRGKFLRVLAELGLPVPKHKAVKGMAALREHLKSKTDKWIKVSQWRGDIETFHWRDWSHDEGLLDFYAHRLGPAKELLVYYVFEPIETEIEDGVDTYCIDGKLPKKCIHGMERKDTAYLCTVTDLADIPEEVRFATEAFAPVLGKYNYRSFFSTEIRIAKEANYFTDPTCRAGSPPSQVMTELYGNLAEIIWAGANGECVEPEPTAEFGAQVLLRIKGERTSWGVVELPKELRPWVKAGSAGEIEGRICSPPDEHSGNDLGWLVATGDTLAETIETIKGYAKLLPDGIDADVGCLADLLGEIKAAESLGMEFTDQAVPEPATVLEGE